MQLTIRTSAQNGHLIVFVINNNNAKILTVTDSSTGVVNLVAGVTYRFEWHNWSPVAADYSIDAVVQPGSPGFPQLNFAKSYDGPHSDLGGFYFTL